MQQAMQEKKSVKKATRGKESSGKQEVSKIGGSMESSGKQEVSKIGGSIESRKALAGTIACLLVDDTDKWEKQYLMAFVQSLELEVSTAESFLPLIGKHIDPGPFLAALQWQSNEQKLEGLLVILNFSTIHLAAADARARVLLFHLADALQVSWHDYADMEKKYAHQLVKLLSEHAKQKSAGSERKSHTNWFAVGGLALLGGAVIALTAGLAAPAVASGIAAVGIGGGAATFVGSTVGTALLASIFGVTGTRALNRRLSKRLGDLEEFELVALLPTPTDDGESKAGAAKKQKKHGWLHSLFYDDDDEDVKQYPAHHRAKPIAAAASAPSASVPSSQPQTLTDASSATSAAESSSAPPEECKKGARQKPEKEKPKAAGFVGLDSGSDKDKEGKSKAAAAASESQASASKPAGKPTNASASSAQAAVPSSSSAAPSAAAPASTTAAPARPAPAAASSAPPSRPGLAAKTRDKGESKGTDSKEHTKSAERKEHKQDAPVVPKDPAMNVVLAVNGWLTDMDDVTDVWQCLPDTFAPNADLYSLKWESNILLEFGGGLKAIALEQAKSKVVSEMLKLTVLQGLMAAIAWPSTLLNIASVIDNPWALVLDRSVKASLVLADAIQERMHGNRPLTLIGYSMGAKVIFDALEELARRRELQAEQDEKYGRAQEDLKARVESEKPAILVSLHSLQEKGFDEALCKRALVHAEGNVEAAAEALRLGEELKSKPSWSEFLATRGELGAVYKWQKLHEAATKPASHASAPSASADSKSSPAAAAVTALTDKSDPRGVLFDVFLFGAPVSADPARWRRVRRIVAGRLVNGFSTTDWLLRYAYRLESSKPVAGLQAINADGVESVDLTDIVSGHGALAAQMPEILKRVDFRP